jgi:hypothetical protein
MLTHGGSAPALNRDRQERTDAETLEMTASFYGSEQELVGRAGFADFG